MRLSQSGPLLVALSIAPHAALFAQTPSQPDSRQMTIRVSVSTRHAEPVEGLTKDNFTLFDNKHEEPITGFRALADTQTHILIVLDAVNLPYVQVPYARRQLSRFFSSNGGHLAQPTTFGVLQDSGLQIQPGFSTDGNALNAALDRSSIGLSEIMRSGNFHGAEERLQLSLNTLEKLVEDPPSDGPTRIIWVSPGWPLFSGPNVDLDSSKRGALFQTVVGISAQLQRSQIIVDAINPGGAASDDVGQTNEYERFLRAPRTPRDLETGHLSLQVIAQQSGGLVLNGSNDIAGLIQRAIAQTTAGYELTFTSEPGEHDNEYHELQVKVRRPGVAVHTTAGYYARPAFSALPWLAAEPR